MPHYGDTIRRDRGRETQRLVNMSRTLITHAGGTAGQKLGAVAGRLPKDARFLCQPYPAPMMANGTSETSKRRRVCSLRAGPFNRSRVRRCLDERDNHDEARRPSELGYAGNKYYQPTPRGAGAVLQAQRRTLLQVDRYAPRPLSHFRWRTLQVDDPEDKA